MTIKQIEARLKSMDGWEYRRCLNIPYEKKLKELKGDTSPNTLILFNTGNNPLENSWSIINDQNVEVFAKDYAYIENRSWQPEYAENGLELRHLIYLAPGNYRLKMSNSRGEGWSSAYLSMTHHYKGQKNTGIGINFSGNRGSATLTQGAEGVVS